MSEKIQLGSAPELAAGGRDATHVAIVAVVAAVTLYPGQGVGLRPDGQAVGGIAAYETQLIGIVDPFLKEPVYGGQLFWLCMYPNSIQGLRHDWTHPALTLSGAVNLVITSTSEEKSSGTSSSSPQSADPTAFTMWAGGKSEDDDDSDYVECCP